MNIGIITPSIYMYKKLYGDRIFAPGDLARNLVSGLMKRKHQVFWFSAPEETSTNVIEGDLKLLEGKLKIRHFQDIAAEDKEKMSLYAEKMYYEMDLLTKAYGMGVKKELDVLHVFHSFGYLAHFWEELTGVPTFYTLHDPMPTANMLEYWLFNRFPTHKFLSISKSQQGNLSSHFFGNVYNGIDTNKFAFSEKGGEDLIAVGRMIPQKGIDIAISVAQQLNTTLNIASWLSEGAKQSEYYQKKIVPFVDGKKIKINSLLNEDERVFFFQKAKALISPLQWEEPFGLVMVEAMACGTPVVAYNRGSVPEIVRDGVTGFVIDPDGEERPGRGSWIIKKQGVEGLVEAVQRIGEIDRRACRKHVEDNFSVEKMVEGYEKVYQKILASQGEALQS